MGCYHNKIMNIHGDYISRSMKEGHRDARHAAAEIAAGADAEIDRLQKAYLGALESWSRVMKENHRLRAKNKWLWELVQEGSGKGAVRAGVQRMTKKLSDAERARRYAKRVYRCPDEAVRLASAHDYLAGLRMGRKLEREKGKAIRTAP